MVRGRDTEAPMAADHQERPHAGPERGGTALRKRPSPPKVDRMPPWRVLLHNDDHNDMLDVVLTIQELAKLTRQEAVQRMLEAHKTGVSLLLVTHREHAELLTEQFASRRLTVTIEPDG
jgi:ATP-dependent Clp protease adaptor protein ClpS